MALVLADRVRETTTVVGTGTATLLGAVTGYQSFTAVGNANTTYYVIASQAANEWEVGIGTYTASGTTLSRDTVLSSSNAGALVNFTAGTKDIWVDYAAGKAVTTDTLAYPPAIGNTTPNAATFTTLTATGQTSLGGAAGSADAFRIYKDNTITGQTASFTAPALSFIPPQSGYGAGILRSSTQLFITTGNTAPLILQTASTLGFAGSTQAQISHTASAVNYVQVTGAATGAAPTISAQGSDSNIEFNIATKGTGAFNFFTRSTARQFEITNATSSINWLRVNGSATGNGVQLSAQGTDTNISQVFQSKGTGAINLAAGSSGVNISNGGTVTAITRTAAGSAYTTIPALAISAPTTAGGVQATAAVTAMVVNTVAVSSGGTGYTAGDVLTVSDGTVAPAQLSTQVTVSTVSAGVITAVTVSRFGTYSVLPTNPASVTGGTGSGATFNFTYAISGASTNFTITNAGSGYVEQPTVTFSGGGGSGAAAYATVGGTTSIRSLGTNLDFFTPVNAAGGAPSFRVYDNQSAGTGTYFATRGSTSSPLLIALGGTNTPASISSSGTGSLTFLTNANTQIQFQVAHTASAVNYVQVTGAATTGLPVISAQGSDTNVAMFVTSKGNGTIRFATNNAAQTQLRVSHTTSAVNFLNVTGSIAGAAPVVSVDGNDTNVGLNLTTKGTGAVNLSTGNGIAFQATEYFLTGTTANYIFAAGRQASNPPVLGAAGSDTNISLAITSKGTGGIAFTTSNGGLNQLQVAHTASAVNFVQVTGAATGGRVTISSQGSDANVPVVLGTKGSGSLSVRTNDSATTQFAVTSTASAVNYINVTGATTTNAPVVSALGSDTNIPLVVQPKGTGALQAQLNDGTTTGGNARGANAVDWQTSRSAAVQVASGANSVLGGGFGSLASGSVSGVFAGNQCQATNFNTAVLGGTFNVASGINSTVVGGASNTSAGYFNFMGGGFTNSGTSGASVTTQSGTMNGTTAVTLSGSNASIRVGQYITGTSIASDTYVAAISGTSLTLSKVASGSSTSTLSFFTPHGVVVGGGNNQATGAYSFIGGGGDAGTAANRNVASGDWSFVGGGVKNTASGLGSFIGGGGSDGTSVLGNTASGVLSFIGGGFVNTASSQGTVIGGGAANTANSLYGSIAGGVRGTTRAIQGNQAVAPCVVPIADVSGVSQLSLLVLARQTTDATATVLTSNGSGAGTTNQVILPNNAAYFFRGEVVSGVTGGGNTKGWTIEGVIKRGANAASTALVGTPTVTSMYADVGAATWTIALSADTTNGGLAVTFTGQAGTTIRTVARINTVEMTF